MNNIVSTESRIFDLNIQEVLDNWEIHHAIRELIANAFDERSLTSSEKIKTEHKGPGYWEIRDFGRGIRDTHFVQNENPEKTTNPDLVIGKFGVGLKDAIAVFFRNDVDIIIESSFGTFRPIKEKKRGSDIETIHMKIDPPDDPNMKGTRFTLRGLQKENDVEEEIEMKKAISLFLVYSDAKALSPRGKYGQVFERSNDEPASIYIKGVKSAEEDNFCFSYNVLKLNKKMNDAQNRERKGVGRDAYYSRVKDVLKSALKEGGENTVASILGEDLRNLEDGTSFDELGWVDIQVAVCENLNKRGDVVFMTRDEEDRLKNLVSSMIKSGNQIYVIPKSLKDRLVDASEGSDNPFRTVDIYAEEKNVGLEYKWMDVSALPIEEIKTWGLKTSLVELLGGDIGCRDIILSENTHFDKSGQQASIEYNRQGDEIIVNKKILKDEVFFFKSLVHQIADCRSRVKNEDKFKELDKIMFSFFETASLMHLDGMSEVIEKKKEENQAQNTGSDIPLEGDTSVDIPFDPVGATMEVTASREEQEKKKNEKKLKNNPLALDNNKKNEDNELENNKQAEFNINNSSSARYAGFDFGN